MISVKNISKHYGGRELFSDVSFDILAGERAGLVGRNGHGKTTLFRLITGQEQPDEGRIFKPNNYSFGYLGQHLNLTKSTVLEEGCQGLKPQDLLGGEWKVKKTLSGLGFSEEDFSRSPSEFSGGFQMRIALAKVLVSDPNMLLLDEPTNFLDIVSIRWLERFLRSWRGELIVISHDRDLVDSVTTHIVGIHRAKTRKIKGPTAKYYAQLQADEILHEKKRLEEEKERERMTEYINRFRSTASRARVVQASIKKIEKMGKLDKLAGIRTLSFSFKYEALRAHQVMDVRDLSFSYDGGAPYLISGLSFTVNRHDKICIVGKNGKGKTTLLKLLSGRLKPVSGAIKTHTAALAAYYEQANTADLNDELTVEEEISRAGASIDKSHARGICGAMMFSGVAAEKKVKVLSGGERSRVLLGKLLVAPSNILFLDEPTHHLDIESCQAMMDAVRDFEGAALVVAHDEHFLNEVATKLIIFKNDRVFLYPGTYKEFLESVGWDEDVVPVPAAAAAPQPQTVPAPAAAPEPKPQGHGGKMARKARAEFNAMKAKVLKPLESRIKSLEDEIMACEARVKELNGELSGASRNGRLGAIRRSEIGRELKALSESIDSGYAQLSAAMTEYDAQKLKFSA
ncbi:MAG: ABC-F family ATP-binding cassette domain-containing protein [Candidatus Omnitrophica bacterium]|nr:ABC-F family ATP-binding cassette domain-containing protein [Candidatus Omnitrophota bacterium]